VEKIISGNPGHMRQNAYNSRLPGRHGQKRPDQSLKKTK